MDISISPAGADDEGKLNKDVESAKTDGQDAAAAKAGGEAASAAGDPKEPAKEEAAASATAAPEPMSGALIPFVAAEARQAPPDDAHQRARFDRLLGYGAHAALIVALVGFAWALSGYVIKGFSPQAAKPDAEAVALTKERAEKAELQHTTQTMAADIRALKANVEALRTAAAHAPTQDEIRGLEKTIDGLKVKLEATKTETGAALAQVAGKIDHIQAEPAARLKEVAERLERVERQASAPLTTASIAPTPAATINPAPMPLPPTRTSTADLADPRHPQLVSNWVVRDVYDGIALVEGPHGMIEVVTGETIPGVGAVKSIERRGNGWIVMTSRGMIQFARN